jgi:hypothetical protein
MTCRVLSLFKTGIIYSVSHNFRPFAFRLKPRGHTFPVRTVFMKSNISTGNAQANVDMSPAKTHSNTELHKSVARGCHGEGI